MSKFRVKAELLSGKAKYIELDKKQKLTVKDLETIVAKAFSLNGVNLKYKLKNGNEQGLYQDFHLEAALAQSQEAGDRFFVLSVVPGAAISAPAPSVSQPASNPAPVASKPVVENKRQSVNVGGASHTNAFNRLAEQLKDFENQQNNAPTPAPSSGSALSNSGGLKSKFCANCGAAATSGKFCAECGTPYPLATTPSLAPVATPVSKVQETDNKRKRMSFHPGSASNITKISCAACSNALGIDSVNALEKQWHKECFVCQTCKKSLVTEGFKAHEGRPICVECFNSKFGLKCTGCQKAISAAYVQVKGNPWHSDCFVCNRCKKPFDAGYGEKDGEYLCGNCINFY